MDKKAIMGIGTLIILIAMIMVSALAAGVVINSASSLQSKANIVADTVEERLTTGIEVVGLNGYANLEEQTLYGFEILARLKPASVALNFNDISFILMTDDYQIGPKFIELTPCDYTTLSPDTQFCDVVMLGDNDTVITNSELHLLRFRVSDEHVLHTNDMFRLSIITPKGDVLELKRVVPSLTGTSRISIK